LFITRPSNPVSQDATVQLRLLQEVHALVRSVLRLHKDEMQARSEPSTTLHFVRGDNVTIITKNLFLREHHNMKLRYRQLGPFTSEEHIGKHIYIMKLRATLRLHAVSHVVNSLRPCSTASLGLDPGYYCRRGQRRLPRLCCVHQIFMRTSR
jgi:hypothetical protein